MEKKTPVDYIVNLDFKKYHEFVKNRPVNVNYIKGHNSSKWKKFTKKYYSIFYGGK